MILVDTSVWADHLNRPVPHLQWLLDENLVLGHPMITGELAMGTLRQRSVILFSLSQLRRSALAKEEEVLDFVLRHSLHGSGIGYIDAHILVSAVLSRDTTLWTRDKRLEKIAERHRVRYEAAA